MSALPSMTQDLVRFEWQILIAIATKSARNKGVVINPPHIGFNYAL